MRRMLSGMATVLLVAAAGAGCGDGESGPDQEQVLTALEVSAATAALFTVAPGNTDALTLVAKDQRGETARTASSGSESSSA